MRSNHTYLSALAFVVLSPLISVGNSSSITTLVVPSISVTTTAELEEERPFVNASDVQGVQGEIVINEVELNPRGDDLGNEWIEFYNPSDTNATTNGMIINTSNSVVADIPQNVTIQPGDTFIVPLENSSLSNVAEVLLLVNSSSGDILDATPSLVDIKDDDYTWQRMPDGNDEWEFLLGTEDVLNDPSSSSSISSATTTTGYAASCLGSAGCVEGVAIRIVDGDTLYVSANGVIYKIDLSLVRAPDGGNETFLETTMFTRSLCLGSTVLVDQDDGLMTNDGSVVASVYCSSYGLTEELLDNGLAELKLEECGASEFQATAWAQEHGC